MYRANRGIFTFIQGTTPTSPNAGDTWLNTGSNKAYVWHNDAWIDFKLGSGLSYKIAGYMAGGYSGGGHSKVNRLEFETETVSSFASKLSLARYIVTGLSSQTAGYACGGSTTRIDKMLFADDSWSSMSSTVCALSQSRALNGRGFSNGNIGYIAGGTTTRIDKLNYAADTTSSILTGMTLGKYAPTTGFSETRGYQGGSYTGGTTTSSTIQYLQFSDETTASIATTLARLSVACTYIGSISNKTACYVAGRYALSSTIDRFIYSNETQALLAANLGITKCQSDGVGNDFNGYSCGGVNNFAEPYPRLNNIRKLSFSTETTTSVTSNLLYTNSLAACFDK